MKRYIIKRLLTSVVTIWVLITLVFFMVRLIPGDPFTNGKIKPEIVENMMEYYGLNKPLLEQYKVFVLNLLKGDLGYSLNYIGRTVNQIIIDSFPVSADLGIRALIFAIIGGILLGVIAAINHNKIWDNISVTIAIVGISVPSFILGALIQYIFALKFRWFPAAQWNSFSSTILPSFTLGIATLGMITRILQSSMIEIHNKNYLIVAKSKGLSKKHILFKYELRNAIIPVITLLGPTTAMLLTGSFVVEQIFAIPGLGRHFVLSIQNLDYSLTLGLTIFYGTILILMNLIVDILYAIVDPRIRLE